MLAQSVQQTMNRTIVAKSPVGDKRDGEPGGFEAAPVFGRPPAVSGCVRNGTTSGCLLHGPASARLLRKHQHIARAQPVAAIRSAVMPQQHQC